MEYGCFMATEKYVKFIPYLTKRELEVIETVLAGAMRYKSIASSLNISVNTVKTHLRKIYLTVEVNNIEALATLFHGYSQNKAEITPKSPLKIAKSPQMGDRKQHYFAVIFYNIMLSGGKKMQNLKALRIRTKFAIPLVLVIALVIGFAAGKLVSGNRQTGPEIGMKSETVPEGILVNFKEALAREYTYNANRELSGYYEYEYDSSGNQIKMSIHDENGKLSGFLEYEFDSNGKRTKESIYDANGELSGYYEWDYDSKGNLTKISQHNVNGELSSYSEFGYDSKGNLTRSSKYNANGKLPDYYEEIYYEEIEYDSKGNWTKTSSYNANGKLSSYLEIEYDSNENETKYSNYNADGKLSGYYEFEYDSNRNRIKSSRYNANGELSYYEVLIYKANATS